MGSVGKFVNSSLKFLILNSGKNLIFKWTVPPGIDAPCMDECASNTETDGDIQRIQESTWQQKAVYLSS